MAPEIYQGIVAYQSGDSTAAWTLVQKFTPLLKHYAFILHREDGFEDLQCYFLSLLKTLSLERLSSTSDGAIIKYIAISIRHEYIEQAKAKAKEGVVTYIDDLLLSQLPLNLCARANFFAIAQLSVCFSLQFTFRNTSLRLSCFRLHVPLSANGCLWLAQCGRHSR